MGSSTIPRLRIGVNIGLAEPLVCIWVHQEINDFLPYCHLVSLEKITGTHKQSKKHRKSYLYARKAQLTKGQGPLGPGFEPSMSKIAIVRKLTKAIYPHRVSNPGPTVPCTIAYQLDYVRLYFLTDSNAPLQQKVKVLGEYKGCCEMISRFFPNFLSLWKLSSHLEIFFVSQMGTDDSDSFSLWRTSTCIPQFPANWTRWRTNSRQTLVRVLT